MPIQFASEVLKPWDELNHLTAQPLALDPQISDIARLTVALANAINHTADRIAVGQNIIHLNQVRAFKGQLHILSKEYRLISDVSDMAKHGTLKSPSRKNKIQVVSLFEWCAVRGFRFIRNSILISHAEEGDFDFLETSLASILFLMSEMDITPSWSKTICESSEPFRPQAALLFDSRYCIQMNAVKLQFLSRSDSGSYTPCNPPQIDFVVL